MEGTVPHRTGRLIVNADDWGRNRETTDRTFECTLSASLSSVSAMVFMEDSERAAEKARESRIDAGLHLNFTTEFTARNCSIGLVEHLRKVAAYLLRHRLAQVLFHPGLARSFEYLVSAQIEEFHRLYGAKPNRIDGHHHMHLCANVILQKLLPAGTVVRRNFSFQPGEKTIWNRTYRRLLDGMVAHRHQMVDFLFSIAPLEPATRLQQIFSLAHHSVIEIETHPIQTEEYRFLTQGEILRRAGVPIASRFELRRSTLEWLT